MRLSSPLIQLALLAVAVSALPRTASAETIATCVSSSGSIHFSANGVCGSNQQLLIWNVVGPQGPQGAPGPTGAAGPSGAVVDLRSPSYQAMGKPSGLEERTVVIRVRQRSASGETSFGPSRLPRS